MSTVYKRNVVNVNWIPLVPGYRDVYGEAREFQVAVWLEDGFDGWNLTPVIEALASAVGVSADQVMLNQRHYLREHPNVDPEFWMDGTLYFVQRPRDFSQVGKATPLPTKAPPAWVTTPRPPKAPPAWVRASQSEVSHNAGGSSTDAS